MSGTMMRWIFAMPASFASISRQHTKPPSGLIPTIPNGRRIDIVTIPVTVSFETTQAVSFDNGDFRMRNKLVALLALAALVPAAMIAVSPKAATNASAAATAYGIDILDLTRQAADLPEQQFAAN